MPLLRVTFFQSPKFLRINLNYSFKNKNTYECIFCQSQNSIKCFIFIWLNFFSWRNVSQNTDTLIFIFQITLVHLVQWWMRYMFVRWFGPRGGKREGTRMAIFIKVSAKVRYPLLAANYEDTPPKYTLHHNPFLTSTSPRDPTTFLIQKCYFQNS